MFVIDSKTSYRKQRNPTMKISSLTKGNIFPVSQSFFIVI